MAAGDHIRNAYALPRLTLEQQAQYCYWRMNLWVKGYGTYNDIDRAVSEGGLTPGQEWKAPSSAGTEG